MGCDEDFIKQVCQIVGTHHDRPENPPVAFRILYDADKIVMFSPDEFPIYDARPKFDWDKIVGLIYTEQGKKLAKAMLQERRKEQKQATESKHQ
jgi:hypothetical protein